MLVVNNGAQSSLTSSLVPTATTRHSSLTCFWLWNCKILRVPMQRSETWWNPLTFWCGYNRFCLSFLRDLSSWAHESLTFAGSPSVSSTNALANSICWAGIIFICFVIATNFGEDKMSEGIKASVPVFQHSYELQEWKNFLVCRFIH